MPSRTDYLNMTDDELLAVCRTDRFRASGPGGQHRNKTDSAVRVTVKDTEISASCVDHRSQHQNRREAVKRLRFEIALALREEAAPWQGAWKIGRKDRRYPGFAGALLDALDECEYSVGDAGRLLGTSTGRLVRILAGDTRLWALVNQQREKRGLKALRA
jgi:hypothetical protein